MIRRPRARTEADIGFAAVEAILVIPVLIVFTMVSVQFVMLWHSRHVAEAAARDGLRVARGYEATAAQGVAQCRKYLAAVAGDLLDKRSCLVVRSDRTVSVNVRGSVSSVIPFGSFEVDEMATGPLEQFVGEG